MIWGFLILVIGFSAVGVLAPSTQGFSTRHVPASKQWFMFRNDVTNLTLEALAKLAYRMKQTHCPGADRVRIFTEKSLQRELHKFFSRSKAYSLGLEDLDLRIQAAAQNATERWGKGYRGKLSTGRFHSMFWFARFMTNYGTDIV